MVCCGGPRKKRGTFYYRNISGDELKLAAGENYSHYSFTVIQKQKGCNCNYFVKDAIENMSKTRMRQEADCD